MKRGIDRRGFLKDSAASSMAIAMASMMTDRSWSAQENMKNDFDISLAEWSLHNMLWANELKNLDFPAFTKKEFDISAVEYVNTFFQDKAEDQDYLQDLKSRCESEEVTSVLIMVDAEGDLGDPDDDQRTRAVENHFKWVDAAKFLGCHSIRVNAASEGSYEEQMKLAADGLRRLTEFAADKEINVIVENHGGLSSNGSWLAATIQLVSHDRCGTLPDFGNFCIKDDEWYDRYQGVEELMPYAKAVSAKSHDFDEDGNETCTDYRRMMKIVLDAGYQGYVGIEYEGESLSEVEGIRATKKLLMRIRDELRED